jgi:hypothetical protein
MNLADTFLSTVLSHFVDATNPEMCKFTATSRYTNLADFAGNHFSGSAPAQSTNASDTPSSAQSVPSIPDLLSMSPGFGSRQHQRSIPVPINRQMASWRIGTGGGETFLHSGSFNWAPLSARSALRPSMSAIGIGFAEKERTKRVRISVGPDIRKPQSARYVPPARRGSTGEERELGSRRTPLSDTTHRRVLAELLKEPKAGGTPVAVEFPESTVIESGKLPSWDERRRIRLARGTAIATVKTVIKSPSETKTAVASPGLTRSIVAIAREDREEGAADPSGTDTATLPGPLTARSVAGEVVVPRTDSE